MLLETTIILVRGGGGGGGEGGKVAGLKKFEKCLLYLRIKRDANTNTRSMLDPVDELKQLQSNSRILDSDFDHLCLFTRCMT